jgi:hypothetical protein
MSAARRNGGKKAAKKWSKFAPPPIPQADAHAAALRAVRKMTPEQVLESSVRAGIHRPDGSLTKRYGG